MGLPQSKAGRSRRERALLIVQVASLLIVAATVYSLVLSRKINIESGVGFLLLLLAISMHELAVYVSSQRLKIFVEKSVEHVSLISLWRINIEAHFYYLAVPFGNDLARVMKIKALDPDIGWKRAFAATFADRVAGLLATLVFLLTVPLALAGRIDPALDAMRDGVPANKALFTMPVGIVLAFAATVYLAIGRKFRESLGMLRPFTTALPIGLLMSLMCMSLMIIALLAFGRACGIAVTPLEVAAGLSVLVLSQAIPLALFGIGAGEAAAGGLYLLLGYSSVEAATLALVFMSCA